MSRISIKTRNDLPNELKPLWDKMLTYGAFENQAGVMAHRLPIFKNVWNLLIELSEEAALPKRYLELCLVTVSLLNRCTYCVSHHAPKLIVQGISEAMAYLRPSRPWPIAYVTTSPTHNATRLRTCFWCTKMLVRFPSSRFGEIKP
jgi:AhpD family alkylhydroperoxidase